MAPRSQGRPSDRLHTLLMSALVAGAALFLLGSAAFIYQESRSKGLPFVSAGNSAPGPLGLISTGKSEDPEQLAHQNGPCISCHSSKADEARLYLAINGQDVTDNPSVAVQAGELFELAYHIDATADRSPTKGVGVEIITPRGGWSVGPGSGKETQGWSPSGSGRTFWSPTWSRGGSAGDGEGGLWRPVGAQQGAFFVDFSSSSWAVPGVSAAARDDGSQGDADGRAGAMGGDAVVSVPLNAQPGKYEVMVAAVGKNSRGEPAQLSQRIAVQVDAAPSRTAKSTKPPRFKADHGTNRPCGSCHSTTLRRLPANHVGVTNDRCTQCHTTTMSEARPVAATSVPHDIGDRADCLSCHRSDAMRPAPADHGGRPSSMCTLCHRAALDPNKKPVQIPHSIDNRKDCASCHASGTSLIPAMPADHQRRGNDMCVRCHPKSMEKATAPAPDVPHTVSGRSDCLACHSKGFLGSAVVSHLGWAGDEKSCQGCHKPGSQVEVPGRAPETPHRTLGRENCVACHGPSGLRPAPADHAGRPAAACMGCHPSGIDRSGTATRIPHPIEGREACLTCHGGYLIPPVPVDHQNRANDSCLACHRQPPSA